ncbi:hypothetical protein BT67DRAFT_487905 [Trichocladium antarcticum]|uniref:RRM domain-containing protein n=1 Tax=Trichocladium antarcticum TaxID=1450529 RepID=A0AAN6URD9_9PEZI|nr:hypothetical protein BT67DRAFT_487905 [Trichocladium antarcticum]
MAQESEHLSFPTNPEEFDQDERISFSRLDNKYIAVHDDGTEFEFDNNSTRWVPMVDEALIEEQQRGYEMLAAEASFDAQDTAQGRKRKMDQYNDREDNNKHQNEDRPPKNPRRQKPSRGPPQPKQNTAVYVTGLPADATAEEVAELFSRKCGVIAEEIDSGRPRIKMYTDADGNFKGDALVVFFKPQSVDMAIMLLDDTDFRFTPSSSSSKMHVQAADSSYKKTKYDADSTNNTTTHNKITGEGKPHLDKQRHQDKAKVIKKTQKLHAKLADWSDDEPSSLRPADPTAAAAAPPAKGGKWDKVVILRHMFTLQELADDPAALLDIKEDIRDECAKLGPVTNVVLYDEEAEGIVSVRFQTREAAAACLQAMHGRAFAGQRVEAFFATGREKFRRSRDNSRGDAAAGVGGEEHEG